MIMWIVFALFLSLIAAYLIISPHLSEATVGSVAPTYEIARLMDQREHCFQTLKDLELDYQMKKLSEAEYNELRASALSELAPIMEMLDHDPASSTHRRSS